MNKRLISTAVILLLIFSILPAAYADVTYPAPGNIEAGSQLDHLWAVVSTSDTVTPLGNTFPDGVLLETEDKSDGKYIYLRGTPTAVGSFDCVISINGVSNLLCTLNIVPSVPVVTASAGVNCYLNDPAQVSVSATVNDGGSLSYQWYSNPNNNTSGGEAIPGAGSSAYQANTSRVGTVYYYCIVTNSGGGKTSSAVSPTVSVTVGDISVTSISVETLPAKTEYKVGNTLNTAGLTLLVKYGNGSSKTVSQGFSVYPTKLSKAGTQTIEISYQGKTSTFTVSVKQADEVIEGIGVLTKPSKTEYVVGDTLDPSGLSIRVYTNNGHRDAYTDLVCSPTALSSAGTQTITVTYGGKTCTFSVKVREADKPVSLAVSTLPTKTAYTVGDSLDTAGLVLKLTGSSGKSTDISAGFSCSPTRLDKAGKQEITVSYENLKCKFTVTVAEKSADATATPAVSPSVPPTQAPEDDGAQTAKPNIGRSLVTVIIVAAALALVGLCAYVFIMHRGGFEKFVEKLRHRFGGGHRH